LPTGFATASLWVSLVAFFFAFPSRTLGMLFGILAMLLAGYHLHQVGKGKASGRTKAIWGLIIGLLVTFVCLLVATVPAKPIAAAPSYTNLNTGTTQPPVWVDAAPAVAPSATPQVINPKTLGDAVDANKARAAAQWNGKLVQITAKVTDISTAFSSSVSFGDVTSESFSFIQIACYVGDESQLIPFTKGQAATVRGTVEVGYAGVIKLNDCQYVG
jgi:hypothetical protein